MSIRKAQANWQGSLREGNGSMSFGAGGHAYHGPYTHGSRFAEDVGTNPEELIGAALAGCFSMALAADLGRAGFEAGSIETEASVHLEKVDGAQTITTIELKTSAKVDGIDEAALLDIADKTKDNCPVSRALAGVEVKLEASLVG
jgi:osmotically inducible protein OsmC